MSKNRYTYGKEMEGKGREKLKLYPDCMGIESLRGRVLLDDLEGICLEAEAGLLLLVVKDEKLEKIYICCDECEAEWEVEYYRQATIAIL